MLEFLTKIDRSLFFFLNGLHNPTFDVVMFYMTKQMYWLPLFGFIIYKLFASFKRDAWWILLGIALVILFSDQLVSGFMKPYFARLRPTHDPSLQDLVHIVNEYRGGLYSFASSHAANSFGVAFFLWLTTRKMVSWIWIMFVWAAIFSYSRIYLGVHYPLDIAVGALVGCVIAFMVDEMLQFARSRIPGRK